MNYTEQMDLAFINRGEHCMLNRLNGQKEFYRGKSKTRGFTGLYYRNDTIFFAIYPSYGGPVIYYKDREHVINRDIEILFYKNGKNGHFAIPKYNIVIDYSEVDLFDSEGWFNEKDVDLFYMIATSYQEDEFYQSFTWGQWPTHPQNLE